MTAPRPLKVAIIGGGPGGLAAAIELGKLPFVQWTLYEKKDKISETGGGISLQRHTWRMLDLMGASKNIYPDDYFRPSDGHTVQHRNSRTGDLLAKGHAPKDRDTVPNHTSCRMVRPKLQGALLKEVDQARIQTSRKLVRVERVTGKLRIIFDDGFQDEVDLLVGADGIRSVSFIRVYPTPAWLDGLIVLLIDLYQLPGGPRLHLPQPSPLVHRPVCLSYSDQHISCGPTSPLTRLGSQPLERSYILAQYQRQICFHLPSGRGCI